MSKLEWLAFNRKDFRKIPNKSFKRGSQLQTPILSVIDGLPFYLAISFSGTAAAPDEMGGWSLKIEVREVAWQQGRDRRLTAPSIHLYCNVSSTQKPPNFVLSATSLGETKTSTLLLLRHWFRKFASGCKHRLLEYPSSSWIGRRLRYSITWGNQ